MSDKELEAAIVMASQQGDNWDFTQEFYQKGAKAWLEVGKLIGKIEGISKWGMCACDFDEVCRSCEDIELYEHDLKLLIAKLSPAPKAESKPLGGEE